MFCLIRILAATLCPDTITGGTFQNFESCSRFKLDVCGVICDASPVTTWSIQCNEDGSWDNPCSGEYKK